MISAVLDTNVLASGTVSALNAPGKILNAWRTGKFILITSEQIIKELVSVLQKPYFQKYITSDQIDAFIYLLQNESLVAPITVKIHGIATHSEDDLILAAAISAKANYLVTGDQPFLKEVGSFYKGVTLVTTNEFLNQFTY